MKGKSRQLYTILQNNATIRALLAVSANRSSFDKIISPLLPAAMTDHYIGSSLKEGRLTLFVDSSAWLSQLRFLTPNIRRKLIDKGFVINNIDCKIQLRNPAKKAKRRSMEKLSVKNAQLLNQTAETVGDEKLAEALRRLGKHHK